jgi:hypothetical protein
MDDSVNEENNPQPSISKNTSTLQPSGARTAEAQRHPRIKVPQYSGENASEDEPEASPRKIYHPTTGLRGQSHTELRSRNQRRKVNGGNQVSKLKNAERVHPRSSEYGGTALGRAAVGNSRQLDRNTMSDRSYIETFQGRSSEESPWQRVADRAGQTDQTEHLIKFGDRLADYGSGGFDLFSDSEGSNSEGSPAPSNSKAISRPARQSAAIVIKRPDRDSLDIESVRAPTSPSSLYHPDDYASPSTTSDIISAPYVLLTKFSSISNHTISKDKTQGEEAHNSELLAAFGQKIQARCFGEISNQSVDLVVQQSLLSETVGLDTGNGSFAAARLISGPYPYRMSISGLPSFLSLGAVKNFVCQAGLEFETFSVKSVGEGIALVDFETITDHEIGMKRLNGREFRGGRVICCRYFGG